MRLQTVKFTELASLPTDPISYALISRHQRAGDALPTRFSEDMVLAGHTPLANLAWFVSTQMAELPPERIAMWCGAWFFHQKLARWMNPDVKATTLRKMKECLLAWEPEGPSMPRGPLGQDRWPPHACSDKVSFDDLLSVFAFFVVNRVEPTRWWAYWWALCQACLAVDDEKQTIKRRLWGTIDGLERHTDDK